MNRFGLVGAAMPAVLLLAATAAPGETVRPIAERRLGRFEVDTLADGIHLFRPAEVSSSLTNSLVVERDDGLLIVDGQPSAAAARELLSAVAQLSAKPARFLVLSHPHADAAGGASAFPPSVLTVGSIGFRDAMADPSYDFGAEARERAADAAGWKEPPRVSPTLVPEARFTLQDPRHAVEVIPLGKTPAHSRGDLLVWIPDSRILDVGDLLWPGRIPYVGGADIGNWLAALNGSMSMKPAILVPLRGPAVDDRDARRLVESFAWVRGQVEAGFVDAVPSGKITDRVLGSPALSRFLDAASDPARARALIEQVVQEAVAFRRMHGLE